MVFSKTHRIRRRMEDLAPSLVCDPFRDGFAKANKSLLREGQPAPPPMEHTPSAAKLSAPQRQRHQRALLQFLARGPRRQNAHSKAQFHQLLDGLHVSEIEQAVQHDLLFSKIRFHHLERVARLSVKDVMLPRNFLLADLP